MSLLLVFVAALCVSWTWLRQFKTWTEWYLRLPIAAVISGAITLVIWGVLQWPGKLL
jgi:hypothetical protein